MPVVLSPFPRGAGGKAVGLIAARPTVKPSDARISSANTINNAVRPRSMDHNVCGLPTPEIKMPYWGGWTEGPDGDRAQARCR